MLLTATRASRRRIMLTACCALVYAPASALASRGRKIAHRPDRGNSSFLYVMSDDFMTYRILRDGHLARVSGLPPYLGRYPYFVAPTPDGRGVFVGGIDDEYKTPSGYLERFAIGPSGSLVSEHGGSAGSEPVGMAVGKDGHFVYCQSDGALIAFRVLPTGNYEQLPGTPIPTGKSALVSGAPRGQAILISRGTDRRIDIYRPLSDGSLKRTAELNVARQPGPCAWLPSRGIAYVASPESGTIDTVRIGGDGRASVVQTIKAAAGPQQVAIVVHPARRFLYACYATNSLVKIIPIRADGSLNSGKIRTFSVSYPIAMAITPDGRFAYILSSGHNVIMQCRINTDGSMAPLFPALISAPGEPLCMAIGRH